MNNPAIKNRLNGSFFKKMLNSKKGLDPADATQIIISIIIGTVFFYMIFHFLAMTESSANEKISADSVHLNNYYTLKSFLLMPVVPDFSGGNEKEAARQLNEKNARIIDLIQQINLEPENEKEILYKNIFENQLNILSEALPKGWVFTIEKDGKKFEKKENMGIYFDAETEATEIMIPSKNPLNPIKLRLAQKNWWQLTKMS